MPLAIRFFTANIAKKNILKAIATFKYLRGGSSRRTVDQRGETILLYDSRLHRPNERDVVLVFANPKVIVFLFF